MIAADVEAIFVGIASADYACFEVVAAWWGDGCVGGTGKVDGEGEREVDDEEEGRECELHCERFCSRFCFFTEEEKRYLGRIE